MFGFVLTMENAIWLFPAIRQIRGRYAPYFLVLGISGLLEIILLRAHSLRYINLLCVFASSLLVYFLIETDAIRKVRYVSIAFLILVSCGINQFCHGRPEIAISVLLRTAILGIFVKRLITETAIKHSFNIFTAFLILYELSIVLRFFFAITETQVGYFYFYTSMIFESMLGIFFFIFTEESRGMMVKIGKPE